MPILFLWNGLYGQIMAFSQWRVRLWNWREPE